jgi:sulfur carrier protein
MELIINGQSKDIDLSQSNLESLLLALDVKLNGVVVDLNGELYKNTDFKQVDLNTNDKVEVIHFMGGG